MSIGDKAVHGFDVRYDNPAKGQFNQVCTSGINYREWLIGQVLPALVNADLTREGKATAAIALADATIKRLDDEQGN